MIFNLCESGCSFASINWAGREITNCQLIVLYKNLLNRQQLTDNILIDSSFKVFHFVVLQDFLHLNLNDVPKKNLMQRKDLKIVDGTLLPEMRNFETSIFRLLNEMITA